MTKFDTLTKLGKSNKFSARVSCANAQDAAETCFSVMNSLLDCRIIKNCGVTKVQFDVMSEPKTLDIFLRDSEIHLSFDHDLEPTGFPSFESWDERELPFLLPFIVYSRDRFVKNRSLMDVMGFQDSWYAYPEFSRNPSITEISKAIARMRHHF